MNRKSVRAAACTVLCLAFAGCASQEPPPFDPLELQRSERSHASQQPLATLRPLPTTLESLPPTTSPASHRGSGARPAEIRPLGDEPTTRLALHEIVQRAVANSKEVRVAGFDPAIAGTRVVEAMARFDPILFTNLRYEHRDQQTAGQEIVDPSNPTRVILLNVERGDIYTMEPGVKQLLPSGGEIALSYQLQQSEFSPRTFVTNPYWENTIKLQLTQPILRDYGYAVNQARITIARNDQKISLGDFRKTLEDNTFEIENDYWKLAEAEEEVRIQEELLDRTRDTADVLIKRFQAGGDVSRVQTSQAIASVRSREAALIHARGQLGDLSDDIKRRMNDPDFAITGDVVILAADAPLTSQIRFGLQDQIDTAMENRFELGQQQSRIGSADIATLVAKNNTLPKLDLQVSAGIQGLAQDESTAVKDQLGHDSHPSYSFGLALEIPIGNREALSIYKRSQLQRSQEIGRYEFLIEQVSQEVKTSLRDVDTTWQEIAARRRARFAQADSLRAIEQREERGEDLTPTFVQFKLDTQERLADAEREEASAISTYNVAITKLERSKGTLLRYNNVVMEQESR